MKLSAALIDFGFSFQSVQDARLHEPGDLVAFGFPPARIDLLNQIDDVTFEEAIPSIVITQIDDVIVRFIGRNDLLKNKMSTTRLQDKLDVEKLQ